MSLEKAQVAKAISWSSIFQLKTEIFNHYENKRMGIFTKELTKIIVVEIAEINYCVASCDGQKVHYRIAAAFCENRTVEISFAGTSGFTPVFLNSTLRQLYGNFPAELIESDLSFTDIPKEDEIIVENSPQAGENLF